jgi:hypothetical protein
MTTIQTPIDNGVNSDALLGARDALSQAPAAAEFTWRSTTSWIHGTYSRSSVEGFSGLGEDHTHTSVFTFDADQNRGIQLRQVTATVEGTMNVLGILGGDPDVRNGFSGVTVRFVVDADASQSEVEALVAQSQKRSAVFDILTNPTNVTVDVA